MRSPLRHGDVATVFGPSPPPDQSVVPDLKDNAEGNDEGTSRRPSSSKRQAEEVPLSLAFRLLHESFASVDRVHGDQAGSAGDAPGKRSRWEYVFCGDLIM